jgi:phage terminase large subunit-like protein
MSVASMRTEVRALRAELAALQVPATGEADRERYAWYAYTCPCSLPAGECREHPRARAAQRPPEGDWRVWTYTGGRGTGKSRSGVQWLLDRIKRGVCRHGLAIGATAQDLRDVLVEGPSGFLACSPPWDMPRYEPSKRRLTWHNGARVTLLSGEEPDRCRGLNIDTLLADELPHWARSRECWDLAMLALRAGSDPRAMVTTTPKRNQVLLRILAEPNTVQTTESTFANRAHLAPQFIDEIISIYKGTRFERSEILGQIPDTVEGCWFARFDDVKHVAPIARVPGLPILIAVDAGTSRYTAAVMFQCQRIDRYRVRFLVHDDYLAVDKVSADNAVAIRTQFFERFPDAAIDRVYIDGASSARTSIGPAALGEYQRAFGERRVVPIWRRSVTDSLDQIEAMLDRGDLVMHNRTSNLISAFKNYSRQQRAGEFTDEPAPLQHPAGDMLDSLAYGVLGIMPEGRRPDPLEFAPRVDARKVFG